MTVDETQGYFCGVRATEYDLPHPRIPPPVMFIIRRVIRQAFALLREREFPLATAREDTITIELHSVIENDLRRKGTVQGFDWKTFGPVTRHQKEEDYGGEHPRKEPDLCFKLSGEMQPERVLNTHHAIFVECKLVDATHSAGNYCDSGLQRFVNGEYAWAMQDALMLGYARSGRTISKHLISAMQNKIRHKKLRIRQYPEPLNNLAAAPGTHTEALHRSRHQRDFQYVHGKGKASDICIYHSWHSCD